MRDLPGRHTARFWLSHLALPLAVGLLLWLVYPRTGLDDLVERWFYDPATREFPLRDAIWLTAGVHSGLKLTVIVVAALAMCGWLMSFVEPELKAERRRLGWIAGAVALATLSVALLKHASVHHCPWDLAAYGGYAPYIPLFGQAPAGMAPGHCFPAGHASGGFALLALYFGLRDDRPGTARAALLGALALGSVMGGGQIVRGAHFLSHTLWSAWVVWMVLLAAYVVFPPARRVPRGVPALAAVPAREAP